MGEGRQSLGPVRIVVADDQATPIFRITPFHFQMNND